MAQVAILQGRNSTYMLLSKRTYRCPHCDVPWCVNEGFKKSHAEISDHDRKYAKTIVMDCGHIAHKSCALKYDPTLELCKECHVQGKVSKPATIHTGGIQVDEVVASTSGAVSKTFEKVTSIFTTFKDEFEKGSKPIPFERLVEEQVTVDLMITHKWNYDRLLKSGAASLDKFQTLRGGFNPKKHLVREKKGVQALIPWDREKLQGMGITADTLFQTFDWKLKHFAKCPPKLRSALGFDFAWVISTLVPENEEWAEIPWTAHEWKRAGLKQLQYDRLKHLLTHEKLDHEELGLMFALEDKTKDE